MPSVKVFDYFDFRLTTGISLIDFSDDCRLIFIDIKGAVFFIDLKAKSGLLPFDKHFSALIARPRFIFCAKIGRAHV